MNAEDRIEALEAENERLRDRIRQLEDKHGAGFLAPIEWGLTGKETAVVGALLKREHGTKAQIMAALYDPGVDDEPMIKIVDVFICKIRKKLRPFGIDIETRWGVGYYLTPTMKDKIREQMGDARQ